MILKKNLIKSLPLLAIATYGFIASIAYDSVALSVRGMPIVVLPIIALVALSAVSPFVSRAGVLSELCANNMLRPILFSVGQILVVRSLSSGTTFATFSSIAAGTVLTTVLGKLILKERIGHISFFGISITFIGVIFLKSNFDLPPLALFAGVVQGVGVFLAKKRTLSGARPIDMAAASLLTLLLISLPISGTYFFESGFGYKIGWTQILVSGISFALLQSTYCYLAKKIDSWMLSLVANTRIPASILVGALMNTGVFSWEKMCLGLVIFAGILISYLGMRSLNVRREENEKSMSEAS